MVALQSPPKPLSLPLEHGLVLLDWRKKEGVPEAWALMVSHPSPRKHLHIPPEPCQEQQDSYPACQSDRHLFKTKELLRPVEWVSHTRPEFH